MHALWILCAFLSALGSLDEKESPAPQEKEAPRAPERSGEPVSEEERRAFLRELVRRSADVEALRIRFRQEKRLRILRRPRVSESVLWYARGVVSLITRGRDGKVESHLLVRDGELRIHYPALERLEVLPAGSGATTRGGIGAGKDATLALFTGRWKDLEKTYSIEVERLDAPVDAPADAAGPAETKPVAGDSDDTRPAGGASAADAEKPSPGKAAAVQPSPLADTRLVLRPKSKQAPLRELRILLEGYAIREYVQIDRKGDSVRMQILEWKRDVDVPSAALELDLSPQTRTIRLGGRSKGD